jgi:hypothetical protein
MDNIKFADFVTRGNITNSRATFAQPKPEQCVPMACGDTVIIMESNAILNLSTDGATLVPVPQNNL